MGTLTANAIGGVRRDGVAGGEGLQRGHVECAGLDVEPDHRDQQDRRGDEGVEEVFDGCPAAVFSAAEGGDQQRHGDQREFPESVIEEEVEGDEDADHRDLL